MPFSKEKFLPNGSIVLLKGGTKKIVIYGRKQKLMVKEPVMYGYIGCFIQKDTLILSIHLYLIMRISKKLYL